MLNRLRSSLAEAQALIGRVSSRLMPHPSVWTALGFCLGVLSAFYFSVRNPLAGGLLLLASGFLDVVDGAVARFTGRVSKLGVFLDANLDRLGEVVVYAGIMIGGLADPLVIVLTISMSLMVSYARAKVESLLPERPRGLELGERAERVLALSILSIAGLTWLGVVITLVLASLTFAERFVLYTRGLLRGG